LHLIAQVLTLSKDLSIATGETARFCATISLERQVNELLVVIEENKCTNDEQHQRTDEKLNRLLDVVNLLVPASGSTLAQTPVSGFSSSSMSSSVVGLEITNPLPTPELVEIVLKVVSEAQGRVGKKKTGIDKNSFKVCMRYTPCSYC
jgi:hypothetical protein